MQTPPKLLFSWKGKLKMQLLLFYSFESFTHQHKLMVCHWSLSDSKSPQVSRTLLSILADLNITVVKVVSPCFLISKSSHPFINPLGIVSSALYYWYHCHLHVPYFFFNSQARSRYLSLFSISFIFILLSARVAKSSIRQVLHFLLTITWSGRSGQD